MQCSLKNVRYQHPVGQGGFHTAFVENDGQRLTYVYDCGTASAQKFVNREIDAFIDDRSTPTHPENGHIHLLFLSHFDADHINGLEYLLTKATRVHRAVIPYLDPPLQITLLASADSREQDLTGYEDFISNPVEWLSERGVEEVSFVYPSNDDDDGDPQEGWPDKPEDEGGEDSPGEKIEVPSKDASSKDDKRSSSPTRVTSFYDNNNMVLGFSPAAVTDEPCPKWIFRTHVRKASWQKIQAFQLALAAVLAPNGVQPIQMSALLSALKVKATRDKIRKCYKNIFATHNLVSMSLYSGPDVSFPPLHIHSHVKLWKGYGCHCSRGYWRDACGWLTTGDADLSGPQIIATYLKHYARVIEHVGTLVIPHHGAKNYTARELIELPDLNNCVICAKEDSKLHPHPTTLRMLMDYSMPTTHVSEDISSSHYETVYCDIW